MSWYMYAQVNWAKFFFFFPGCCWTLKVIILPVVLSPLFSIYPLILHPPSQATLCWQGQKRTSRASSEQMRHSLGPGGVGRTRLVMVLGVVWTRRRLALLRPCPHVMACRRCNLRDNTQLWQSTHKFIFTHKHFYLLLANSRFSLSVLYLTYL